MALNIKNSEVKMSEAIKNKKLALAAALEEEIKDCVNTMLANDFIGFVDKLLTATRDDQINKIFPEGFLAMLKDYRKIQDELQSK